MPYTNCSPRIFFETIGNPQEEPLVLIEGFGAQFLGWRDEFVAELVAREFFVIRLDNRDVGLSDKMGRPSDMVGNYAIQDMANDVLALLDELALPSAHIVGQSMGGAIAQSLAIQNPLRVRSLALFYTFPAYTSEFLYDAVLIALGQQHHDILPQTVAIETRIESERASAALSPYSFDEPWIRELTIKCYDRCYRPDGIARQACALRSLPDMRRDLPTLKAPTAIIQGRADPGVKIDSALTLARLIPASELHLYPEMGHAIVRELWPDFVAIIARNAARGRDCLL